MWKTILLRIAEEISASGTVLVKVYRTGCLDLLDSTGIIVRFLSCWHGQSIDVQDELRLLSQNGGGVEIKRRLVVISRKERNFKALRVCFWSTSTNPPNNMDVWGGQPKHATESHQKSLMKSQPSFVHRIRNPGLVESPLRSASSWGVDATKMVNPPSPPKKNLGNHRSSIFLFLSFY